MNTWIKVARFQLADRRATPHCPGASWASTSPSGTCWPGASAAAARRSRRTTSARSTWSYLFVGMLSMFRSLPFAFALGVSRRLTTAAPSCSRSACPRSTGWLLAAAEGARGGQRRLGRGPALLPGQLHPVRAVVPDLAHLIRRAGPDVPVRHVDRAGVPALEPARHRGLRQRAGRGGAHRRDHRQQLARLGVGRPLLHRASAPPGFTGLLAALTVVLLAGGYATMRRVTV